MLSPAPDIDAIFGAEPPSADEWRAIACRLALTLESIDRPFSRGAATRERILAVTLDGLRKERPH